MLSSRVEGILIAPVNVPNNNLDYFQDIDIPLVFTTAGYPLLDKPFVISDFESGMYNLTRLLIEKGRKSIAYITGLNGVYTLDLREKGFLKAITDSNINKEIFYNNDVSYTTACNVVSEILKSNKKFDTIICVNDMMAAGAINTLILNKIKIPDDIAVCGYDDVIFAETSPVSITTVKQDIEFIAQKSTDILISIIKGENKNINKNIIVNNETVIRKSI
jgi:LacI family transcriptional regulator